MAGRFLGQQTVVFLAFHNCQRWLEQAFGPSCERAGPAIYDLASKRIERFNTLSLPSWKPEISPDGTKILFMFPGGAPRIPQGFVFWNRETGELPAVPMDLNQVDRFSWRYGFHTSKDLLFYGRGNDARVHVVWVDTETWVKTDQLIETGRGETAQIREVTQDSIIYEVFRVGGDRRDLYTAPITKNNTPIRGKKVAESLVISPQDGSEVLGWLKEGDIFTSGGKTFIFKDGKRHLIENEEAVGYFQGNRSALAEGLTPLISESESKISFLSEDVIGNKDGLWYLRNLKRYKIQNWDWFKERQRYTKVPISIDKGIIEMIPVGEVPGPKEGQLGWLDWDGTLKEFQPYGGRMIIFVGGYDGNTTSQLEAFAQIKAKLVEKGWNERQFLEATYNIDIDTRRKLVLPTAYFSENTKIYPPQSFSKMRLELQRYKEMFPLTKFVLIGHSLGGLMAFESAIGNEDAVETVITLDSPLKGFDRALWNELSDHIVQFMGHEVGDYLVPMGDDTEKVAQQEQKAQQMRDRGTKIFTFANKHDWFVRNKVAVLDKADTLFDGREVALVWELGHFPATSFWGDLVFGHGQILREAEFLDYLVQLLQVS